MPHRKVGPDQPEVRDGLVGENVFPFPEEQCRQVIRPGSSQPSHRRPKAPVAPNSTSRTDAGHLD
jgi:hypothetical protein